MFHQKTFNIHWIRWYRRIRVNLFPSRKCGQNLRDRYFRVCCSLLSHVNLQGKEESNGEWMFNFLQIVPLVNFFSNTAYTSTFPLQNTACARYDVAHQRVSPVSCLMKKAQKIMETKSTAVNASMKLWAVWGMSKQTVTRCAKIQPNIHIESFLIILCLSNQNTHCWKNSSRTGMIIPQVLILKIRYLNLQLDSKGVYQNNCLVALEFIEGNNIRIVSIIC